MLNLFNISHFSSTACTAAMAKRAQRESGEERVTAKSRPMMNLTARMPSVVSSSTSSNPFSIPNFYIRKGRPHGHRYGKAPVCKEHHTANQLQRRCRKKKYENIHDRFIRDKFFRKTMIELGRSEEIIHLKLMSTVATGGFARML